MRKTLITLATPFALGGLLAGCSTSQPMMAPATASEPTVDVVGSLQVLNAAGYQVLSTETAYHAGSIDHVTLTLQRLEGSAWADVTTKNVAQAELSSPVTLKNLRMATEYKIVARAYADAAGTDRIDNTSASDNETGFTTPSLNVATSGDTISTATLAVTIKVKLKDKTFAGQAGAADGVQVTNGTIVNTTATETF